MSAESESSITRQEREGFNERLFMVVKPDGGRYLAEIDQTLKERKIVVTDVYAVTDWERTARSIYQRQLQNAPRSFRVGFESHVWLCQYLFGNQALLLLLDAQTVDSNWESQVKAVFEARNGFRDKFPAASNGTIAIAINLDKFGRDSFRGSGKKKGHLGISQPGSFDPLFDGISRGRWYGNYFKYLHAPGDPEELSFQFQALTDLGIMTEENKVDRREWEVLKRIHCLVPPSKYINM